MLATITRRVNSRLEPNTSSTKIKSLEVGDKISIVELKYGEEYRGNNIWYRDEQNRHFTSLALTPSFENNKLCSLIDVPSLWNLTKNKIIKIGIYDTGVSINPALFADRVTQINKHKSVFEKHADYMSTIIAGNDLKNEYFGFLPNALLYSYQCEFDGNDAIIEEASFSAALKAFLKEEVDIVNVSMSTKRLNTFFNGAEFKSIVSDYNNNDILIVASAGNDGTQDDTEKNFPAAFDDVLSVSGYRIQINSVEFDFTVNVWSGVDVLTPSFSIYDAKYYDSLQVNDKVGSSVSCAIMSGLLGIYKAKYLDNKDKLNISFKEYVSRLLASMPLTTIDSNNLLKRNYRYLDFEIFKNLLNQVI